MTWDRRFASMALTNVHRTLVAACLCANDQFQASLIADAGGCMNNGIAINRVVSYLVRHRSFNFDSMHFLIHGRGGKRSPYFDFFRPVGRLGYDDRVGHFKTTRFPHGQQSLTSFESSRIYLWSLDCATKNWPSTALVPRPIT